MSGEVCWGKALAVAESTGLSVWMVCEDRLFCNRLFRIVVLVVRFFFRSVDGFVVFLVRRDLAVGLVLEVFLLPLSFISSELKPYKF